MRVDISDHIIVQEGKRVPFRQTPNLGGGLTPDGIILHDTAGGLKAEGSISWLCNPAAKASAHVVVGRDGIITQLAHLNRQCWHAGKSNYRGRPNCNGFTVGIEIVNPGRLAQIAGGAYRNELGVAVGPDVGPVEQVTTDAHGSGYWLHYQEEQLQAVLGLCVALKVAYPRIAFIDTHWFISPGRKFDTNPLFPIERIRARVFGKMIPVNESGDLDGIVRIADLNLRGGPNAEAKVLASLPKGQKLLVRDTAMNGTTRWILVDTTISGKPYTGWVAARYVDYE